jgi:DNA-binding NarL/FixJ family response regulator
MRYFFSAKEATLTPEARRKEMRKTNVGVMKPARILIADDHPEFRKVLSTYLSCLPNVIVVGEATDGIDAIEKTEKLDPDIVLMDISMPRCNGLDATRIIKSHWPAKKVVISTMHNNPFYQAEAKRARADGFILKSSLKDSLQAVIDESMVSLLTMAASVVDTHEPSKEFFEHHYAAI